MNSTTHTASTMRDTLARISDLLAEHPDLPPPYLTIYDHLPDTADLKWFLHINGKGGADKQREIALGILRTIGGKWDKTYNDSDADFKQKRDGLSLHVVVVREAVCTRRVVGTETVTLPAVEAAPERTVEREVVEWDCSPVLAEAVTA